MSDRELLEWAARAEGSADAFVEYVPERYPGREGILCRNRYIWNPIIDDGDRFRLARKLDMVIDFKNCVVNGVFEWTPGNAMEEAYAFVRAAAEIGKHSAPSDSGREG